VEVEERGRKFVALGLVSAVLRQRVMELDDFGLPLAVSVPAVQAIAALDSASWPRYRPPA
jgi:hypothetical protein